MDLSEHFNSSEFADVCLKLRTAPDSNGHSTHQENLLLHSQMLRMWSPYFRARLSPGWNADSQTKKPAKEGSTLIQDPEVLNNGLVELVVDVDHEHEIRSARNTLQCMYSGQISATTAACPLELLETFMLASRFQIQRCIDACADALSQSQPHAWDDAALHLLFDLATEVLCSLPSWQAILKTATQQLLTLYGNVPAVLMEEDVGCGLYQRFLTLPYAAVLAWLQEDTHVVHSEDCMLALLTAWVHGSRGRHCSMEQLTQLARGLRLINLSASGMHGLLPGMEWLEEVLASERSLRMALNNIHFRKHVTSDKSERHQVTAPVSEGKIPPSWVAEPRSGTLKEVDQVLTWVVGQEELEALDRDEWVHSAAKLYCSGFWFGLRIVKSYNDRNRSVRLLGVCVGGASAAPEAASQQLPAAVSFTARIRVLQASGEYGSWQNAGYGISMLGEGYGVASLMGGGGSSIASLVGPFLIGGKLQLQAAITAVA